MSEPLLTVDEVADLARTTPETIRRVIRRGELVATKLAGRLLVEPAEFEAWKARGQITPAAAPAPARRTTSLPRSAGGDSVRAFMKKQRQQQSPA